LDCEPRKEAELWRGPGLPDNFPKLARKSREELDFVSGAGRVATIRGQGPSDGILSVWDQLDLRKEIPQTNILLHMLNGEGIHRDV
jgi:hypothetical protein